MRSLRGFVVALVAAGSLAHAEVPSAKPATPDTSYELLRQSVAAAAAERRGDLDRADELLWELAKDSKDPSASFNHGRVLMKLGLKENARERFEEYLRLAPNASDASAVQKVIDELAIMRRTTMVGALRYNDDIVDATILIDGEVAGKSPVEVASDGKIHRIARVGAASVATGSRAFDGTFAGIYTGPSEQNLGNVYIDVPDRMPPHFDLSGQRARSNKLFPARPGHYATTLGTDLCAPIEFDVKGGKTITFIYLEDKEVSGSDRVCHKPTKVRVHQLVHQPYVKWKKS